jgi:hypothetical protein
MVIRPGAAFFVGSDAGGPALTERAGAKKNPARGRALSETVMSINTSVDQRLSSCPRS